MPPSTPDSARGVSARPGAPAPTRSGRDGRESLEFGRVVNLSDALFAIAMTLLVFKVGGPLGGTAADDLLTVVPQVLAFLLSFAVIANFWWQHHSLFRLLGTVEPGMIAINLVLLGAVALVPFPTELIGHNPGATAPAIIYLGLMLVIGLAHLLLVVRAQQVGAWRDGVPSGMGVQLTVGWAAMNAVVVLALLIAVWLPVVGLATILLTGPADHVAVRWARRAPPTPTSPASTPRRTADDRQEEVVP